MKKLRSTVKRNPLATITIVSAIAICALLFFKNMRRCNFFSANLVEILTILLGIIVAFYLAEHMTDQRRRNDCIEHVIAEIESFVSKDENFSLNASALMKQTSCANRIKYLKDASFPDIKDDITFIETHFIEIRDLFSNHSASDEELKTVKKDIDKHRDCIVDKCCKIRIGLYSTHI